MSYTLSELCADLSAILKAQGQSSLPEIARKLSALLSNLDFVGATFSDDMPPGKCELWQDPQADAYVLAHVQEGGKVGKPHSPGASWAVHARGVTEMTEWRRINSDAEPGAVLEMAGQYALRQGQTRGYASGVIHSTAHPQKAWVIRVTGSDLEAIPPYRFSVKTDRILE